ncbi:hypothetical protein S40288_07015 [Stachybotrys chartarum IBT 40288]|nr:hypothetical protein S40288_07015 [Stachybotrys chartarum IBT 40288]
MCRDQQEICIYCGFQRHVHYQWCKPYIHDLRETVVQWPRVLPTPEDCPDYEKAAMARARVHIAAQDDRALRHKQRFADMYFQKRPVRTPHARSLLADGLLCKCADCSGPGAVRLPRDAEEEEEEDGYDMIPEHNDRECKDQGYFERKFWESDAGRRLLRSYRNQAALNKRQLVKTGKAAGPVQGFVETRQGEQAAADGSFGSSISWEDDDTWEGEDDDTWEEEESL